MKSAATFLLLACLFLLPACAKKEKPNTGYPEPGNPHNAIYAIMCLKCHKVSYLTDDQLIIKQVICPFCKYRQLTDKALQAFNDHHAFMIQVEQQSHEQAKEHAATTEEKTTEDKEYFERQQQQIQSEKQRLDERLKAEETQQRYLQQSYQQQLEDFGSGAQTPQEQEKTQQELIRLRRELEEQREYEIPPRQELEPGFGQTIPQPQQVITPQTIPPQDAQQKAIQSEKEKQESELQKNQQELLRLRREMKSRQ